MINTQGQRYFSLQNNQGQPSGQVLLNVQYQSFSNNNNQGQPIPIQQQQPAYNLQFNQGSYAGGYAQQQGF